MKWLIAACAALGMMVCATHASARTLQIRYEASDAWGWEAPPSYGLRLDGVFGGTDVVTFHFNDVFFDVFDDGTALLHGLISVAAIGGAAPGAAAADYEMNVLFQANPSFPGDPDFDYYSLVPLGDELVNSADAGDTIGLIEFPLDGSKPFRTGVGVFENFKCTTAPPCLGAAGWLVYDRDGVTNFEGAVADFIFELAPIDVPEPALIGLLGLGLFAIGTRLR